MAYPDGTKPTDQTVHPTPVYETLTMGIVALVLWRLRDRFTNGTLFALYLLLAGTERFLVEFIRRNNDVAIGLTYRAADQPGDDDRRRGLAAARVPAHADTGDRLSVTAPSRRSRTSSS